MYCNFHIFYHYYLIEFLIDKVFEKTNINDNNEGQLQRLTTSTVMFLIIHYSSLGQLFYT